MKTKRRGRKYFVRFLWQVLSMAGLLAPMLVQAQTPPACVAPPVNLVSWWRGEGDARDQQAHAHGVTQSGGSYVSGKVGQAFRFAGVNGLVTLGNSSPFRQSSAITYSFWTSIPAGGGGKAMGAGAAVGNGYGGVSVTSSGIAFNWTPTDPPSDTGIGSDGITVPSDEWVHVAVAVDYVNKTRAMYLNGNPIVTTLSQPVTTWTPNGSYNTGQTDSIGGRFVNVWNHFNGDLDEVDVYSRALSASEIAAIYAAGAAGKCLSTCATPPSGLIGWWRGENNATDFRGGHNGTLQNGATYAGGLAGTAFSFDGVDDEVNIPSSSSLSPWTGGEMTLEAWVYLPVWPAYDPFTGWHARTIAAKASASGYEFGLWVGTGGLVGFNTWQEGGVGHADAQGGLVVPGRWHHLAGVQKDGQFIRLYVDGLQVAESTIFLGTMNVTASPFRIGHRGDGQHLNGLVDEVTLYDRALSASEIATIYAAGSAGKCTTSAPTITCPGNITEQTTDPAGKVVNFSAPVTSGGNGSVTVACTPPSGSVFPIGTTTVNCNATDTANQTATCSFTITIYSALSLSPSSVTVAPSGSVTFSAMGGIGQLTYTILQNNSGGTIDAGTGKYHAGNQCGVTDIIRVIDAANHTANATVQILDGTPPVITSCAAAQTIPAGPNCQAALPDLTGQVTATDACGATTITQTPAAGTLVGIGPHTVTFRVTDAAGNSTACDVIVTVADTLAPVITACPHGEVTLTASGFACLAAMPDFTTQVAATDSCGPVEISQTPPAGVDLPPALSALPVLIRVRDGAGNTAICTVNVSVIKGPPEIIICPPNQTLTADANGGARLPDLGRIGLALDHCHSSNSPLLLPLSQSPIPGTRLEIGTHTVSFTTTSHDGRIATCSTQVTVRRVSYGISGQIARSGTGVAVPDVLVRLVYSRNSRTTARVTRTDSTGRFGFSDVPRGASGVFYPVSSSFRFNPTYGQFQNLNEDVTGDFTARSLVGAFPIPLAGMFAAGDEPPIDGIPLISGLLLDTNGLALADVGVELSGDDHRASNTSATGEFLFDSLPMNGNFTLRPENGERIYDPASLAVSNLVGAEFAIFVELPSEPLPMPSVSIQPDVGFDEPLTISWSGAALDYVLESTTSLTTPDWQPAIEQQLQVAGQVVVPLEQSGSQRFYRLRAP